MRYSSRLRRRCSAASSDDGDPDPAGDARVVAPCRSGSGARFAPPRDLVATRARRACAACRVADVASRARRRSARRRADERDRRRSPSRRATASGSSTRSRVPAGQPCARRRLQDAASPATLPLSATVAHAHGLRRRDDASPYSITAAGEAACGIGSSMLPNSRQRPRPARPDSNAASRSYCAAPRDQHCPGPAAPEGVPARAYGSSTLRRTERPLRRRPVVLQRAACAVTRHASETGA